MRETRQSIVQWAHDTFPGGDPESPRKALRLLEEVIELCKAAGASQWEVIAATQEPYSGMTLHQRAPDRHNIPSEAADAEIVLSGVADVYGFDLDEQVDAKMAINRSRVWNPRGDGTGYHQKSMCEYRGGPYIGITGFTSRQQVQQVLAVIPPDPPGDDSPGRSLMVGVLASNKTLAGQPVRRPRRSPLPDVISSIWVDGCFNVLHYHDPDPSVDFCAVAKLAGLKPGYGMQLNIVWPQLRRVRQLHESGIRVILQLGAEAISRCGDRVVEWLEPYRDYIDYALVDLSGGRGLPVDDRSTHCAEQIFKGLHGVQLAVAGGLGPGRLSSLDGLLGNRRLRLHVSVDAESGLRDDDDELSITKCLAYLREVTDKLRGQAP